MKARNPTINETATTVLNAVLEDRKSADIFDRRMNEVHLVSDSACNVQHVWVDSKMRLHESECLVSLDHLLMFPKLYKILCEGIFLEISD